MSAASTNDGGSTVRGDVEETRWMTGLVPLEFGSVQMRAFVGYICPVWLSFSCRVRV